MKILSVAVTAPAPRRGDDLKPVHGYTYSTVHAMYSSMVCLSMIEF